MPTETDRETFEREIPRRGACGFCDSEVVDGRHRFVDVIRNRREPAKWIAHDFDVSIATVHHIRSMNDAEYDTATRLEE